MHDHAYYMELANLLCDGELSASEESALAAHMAQCPDCARRARAASAVSAALRDNAFAAEPPALRKPAAPPRLPPFALPAAAACLALALGLTWFLSPSGGIYGGDLESPAAVPPGVNAEAPPAPLPGRGGDTAITDPAPPDDAYGPQAGGDTSGAGGRQDDANTLPASGGAGQYAPERLPAAVHTYILPLPDGFWSEKNGTTADDETAERFYHAEGYIYAYVTAEELFAYMEEYPGGEYLQTAEPGSPAEEETPTPEAVLVFIR
ncbi:MAG: zf-HC2 domain-containing protein [Oscillospiraceae bacterium]|jgi:hypothetical protein|nr:zf-HC2 domain-containing protein [Oscillospiraceae bacterium]